MPFISHNVNIAFPPFAAQIRLIWPSFKLKLILQNDKNLALLSAVLRDCALRFRLKNPPPIHELFVPNAATRYTLYV